MASCSGAPSSGFCRQPRKRRSRSHCSRPCSVGRSAARRSSRLSTRSPRNVRLALAKAGWSRRTCGCARSACSVAWSCQLPSSCRSANDSSVAGPSTLGCSRPAGSLPSQSLLLIAHWWHDIVHERLSQKRRKTSAGCLGGVPRPGLAQDAGCARGRRAAARAGSFANAAAMGVDIRSEPARARLPVSARHEPSRRDGHTSNTDRCPDRSSRRWDPRLCLATTSRASRTTTSSASVERVRATGGGLFAVVGERGAGKTTLLERISREAGQVRSLDCPLGGEAALAQAMAQAVRQRSRRPRLEDSAALVNERRHCRAAHRRCAPPDLAAHGWSGCVRRRARRCSPPQRRVRVGVCLRRGGVAILRARSRGSSTLRRRRFGFARGARRPSARLLVSRTAQAGLEPTFDQLLSDLPDGRRRPRCR